MPGISRASTRAADALDAAKAHIEQLTRTLTATVRSTVARQTAAAAVDNVRRAALREEMRAAEAAMTRERCVDALRAASSREADDEADAYYAALSLHRALATRANRDDDEAMARCVATCEEVVERYARRRGGRDGAMRRETVALAALTVARARGPAAAAGTLRGGDERASVGRGGDG